MMPKPAEMLKKICPAAASQVSAFHRYSAFGFHIEPRPFQTLRSGCAGSGVPSVSTRTRTHSAQIAISGIATLQNFSMPRATPR